MPNKKKQKSVNVDEEMMSHPAVQVQLEQRARERYLTQLSERERAERLASLNERERRASVDHEARLASERERLSMIKEKEKRRTSLATEPLEEARLQDEAVGRVRRNTIVLPRKGRRRSYLKRGRRRRSRKHSQTRSNESPDQHVKEETRPQEKPNSNSNKKPLQMPPKTKDKIDSNWDSDSDSEYELVLLEEPPHPFKDAEASQKPKVHRPSAAAPQQMHNAKPKLKVVDLEAESGDQVKDGKRRKDSTGQRKVSVTKETEALTRNISQQTNKQQKDLSMWVFGSSHTIVSAVQHVCVGDVGKIRSSRLRHCVGLPEVEFVMIGMNSRFHTVVSVFQYDQFYKQRSVPLHKDPRRNKKHEYARSVSDTTLAGSASEKL